MQIQLLKGSFNFLRRVLQGMNLMRYQIEKVGNPIKLRINHGSPKLKLATLAKFNLVNKIFRYI